MCVCLFVCGHAHTQTPCVCACGPQVGLYECLFEGVNAFKRIQMGDGDDDGAVLYGVAQGCFVCLLVCVLLCCPRVCDSVGLMSGAAQVGSREKG